MTDTKRDPQWFVTLIKVICTIFYIPLMIACLWMAKIYITDEVHTVYNIDTTKELFTRPYFIIPITLVSFVVLCWDLYKKLTYKQK